MENKAELWDKMEKEVVKEFALDLSSEVVLIKPLDKKREMVLLQLLLETMEEQGATQDELMKIFKYMVVVVNAEKDKLDWEKAYYDLGIDDFVEKYCGSFEEETKGEINNEE